MNRKAKLLTGGVLLSAVVALAGCGDSSSTSGAGVRAAAGGNGNQCWGQASAVFAQTGEMGQHSSQQPNPRLGLRNLARALADAGVIPDDSMGALGVFVSNELGLSIDACL